VTYATERGPFHAVDGVSFDIEPGTNLGLVGESGCGKSTVVKALMGLLPPGAATSGTALLDGRDILGLSDEELRDVRWTRIALVTQSAMNSLDPVYSIGDQIVESIRAHEDVGHATAWARAEEMFAVVGLPAARLHEFPHQFSGGMRQRAVIAMALSLNAGLLLADEPTTALDPIMQDQIMARIRGIHEHMRRSMILVTHDIAVVSETCENTAVMYAGQLVERGPTAEVLEQPLHPYTMGLKNAFPRLPVRGEPKLPLISIPGSVPNLLSPPRGCRFASRCPFATDLCRESAPPLGGVGSGHVAACHYIDRAPSFREAAGRAGTWKRQE
jgi:peptide/nickel transport system ATP-binding protein